MHFSTRYRTDENMEQHKWYCMPYRPDFLNKLEKYRFLPNPSVKNHFKQTKLVEEQKSQLVEGEKKIQQQKEWLRSLEADKDKLKAELAKRDGEREELDAKFNEIEKREKQMALTDKRRMYAGAAAVVLLGFTYAVFKVLNKSD